MAKETRTGSDPPGAVPPVLAPQPASGLAAKPPPGAPAAISVPLFGGNRGGKKRKDGLPPGSPAAEEADKKYDRERKQAAREKAADVAQPPPLPSLVTPGPGSGPASPPDFFPCQQPADPPPVPWTPETFDSLVEQLISAAEENRVGNYLSKCAEAGITGKLVAEIETDARLPASAKTLLKHSLPRLAAKWLNKAGISAEWQEEISVLTALILIFQHNRSTEIRFKKIIAEIAKKQPETKP